MPDIKRLSRYNLLSPPMDRKVVTSAIVLQPPLEQWGQIQEIRKTHDKAYSRWMPHINLIYPFVPEHDMPPLLPKLSAALSNIEPFTVTLQEFDNFSHGARNKTIYLRPSTQEQGILQKLETALENMVPFCNDLSTRSEQGFIPHLTVGQATEATLRRYISDWSANFRPVTWSVTEVYLISRTGDEPFKVKYTIPLGRQVNNQISNNFTIANGYSLEKHKAELSSVFSPSKPLASSNNQTDLDKVAEKVEKWLRQMHSDKLPKTPEKFENSIRTMCILQTPAISVEEALQYLQDEGYLNIDGTGNIEYTVPTNHRDSASLVKAKYESTSLDYAKARIKDWIAKDKNAPKSLEKLKNSLYHLTITKITVPTQDVLLYLTEKGVITSHETKTGGSAWGQSHQLVLTYNL